MNIYMAMSRDGMWFASEDKYEVLEAIRGIPPERDSGQNYVAAGYMTYDPENNQILIEDIQEID